MARPKKDVDAEQVRRKKRKRIAPVNNAIAPAIDVTMETLKKEFVDLLETGTVSLKSACDKIGKAPITVWRWRKADPAFDAAVVAAYEDSDSVRVALVEDSLFNRLIKGEASPVEMIFYLKNRAPERWKDRRENAITVDDMRGRLTPEERQAEVVRILAERN